MEERPVCVGQHQHPAIAAQVNLHTVYRLLATFPILLTQDTHHFALVLPGAVDLRTNEVVRRKLVDHLGEPCVLAGERLQQLHRGEHAVEGRMQLREDEAPRIVAYHHHAWRDGSAGQRLWHHLGIDDAALQPLGDLLDDTRRGHRRSDDATGPPAQRQINHRGEQFAAIQQITLVIYDIDALTASVNAHTKISAQRPGDRAEHLNVALEFLARARIARRIARRVQGDHIGADGVEDGRHDVYAGAVAIIH